MEVKITSVCACTMRQSVQLKVESFTLSVFAGVTYVINNFGNFWVF